MLYGATGTLKNLGGLTSPGGGNYGIEASALIAEVSPPLPP